MPIPRIALLMCFLSSLASAANTTSFPDAASSDPVRLGWMVGSPPPNGQQIALFGGLKMR